MNTAGPPQGGFNSVAGTPPPPSPVAVQQTTVIQVGTQKSVAGAVLLALFFGPLGMLYVTVSGALIMFVISFLVAFATLGLGLLITLPICAVWAGVTASSHNNRMQGLATQQAVASGGAVAPAGWHDDPGGSGRLRYYDGMRWTSHFAEHAREQQAPAPPAKQLDEVVEPEAVESADKDAEDADAEAPTAVVKAEPQGVFCGACGHRIAATARFCSACGETQAIS